VRAAIISDVHSNLAALETVLRAIEDEQVDELWCLGDLVGYGADPERCVEILWDRCDVTLAGNHDLVVAGSIDMSVFTHDAGTAARWTAGVLSDVAMERLKSLVPFGARNDVELYHASIRDPIWEYVVDPGTAAACLALQEHNLALIGHSHVPLAYAAAQGELVLAGYAEEGSLQLAVNARYLINPGSVGQPRDGDPRAAYLVLDLDDRLVTWRRIGYDIAAAQQAIVDAGLPRSLAIRLSDGR
jgi:predicted phosphodiesterase